jgi:predicted transcriptional regulator
MKRSRFEIIHDILQVCRKPSTKGKVLRVVYLSYQTTEKYLSELKKRGLIECENGYYTTTSFGLEFLEGLGTLLEIWDSWNLEEALSTYTILREREK